MEEKQEKLNIQEIESNAEIVDSYMKGDKPYRKVPRNFVKPVLCYDCKNTHNLFLIPDNIQPSSFKRVGHKKNRDKLPLLDKNGNKVYLCGSCIQKRAKGEHKK